MKSCKKLRPADEVAVGITRNTRLFYDAVAPYVARLVVVATHQFRIISQSVKKTDRHDARALSLYLSKGLCRLPGGRSRGGVMKMLWDPPTEIQASGFRSPARRVGSIAER
jgi:hypothetical protein